MADEKLFADGCHFDLPPENAPEWVLGKISIKVADFIDFLKAHKSERGFVTLDVKKSQKGNVYVELNTWHKSDQHPAPTAKAKQNTPDEVSEDDILSSIPF
jgi:hypothetical protein